MGPLKAQQPEKIYLNPKTTAVQQQVNFIDSIHFTPLQTPEGISVNEFAIAQLTDQYLLITDYSASSILIFTPKGLFIKKIDFKDRAGNLFPAYNQKTNELVFFGNNSNYTLTSKDRVKIQLDWSNERNLKYFRKYVIDLADTSFAIRKVKPDKYNLIGAYPLNKTQYVLTRITTSPLYKDSTGYELSIFEDEKPPKIYFPYNRVNEPRFLFSEENVSISRSATPYVSYVTRPYCDTIYKLVNDKVSPAYQLVMPLENSLPASFFTDGSISKSDRENYKRNNGWGFRQVRDFFETPRLIYMTISFFLHYESFVYDKKTRTAYNGNKIKGDARQYNLSLLGANNNVMRSGHTFYRVLKADNLVSFFKQNTSAAVPKELAAFLQGNPDKNFPLLVAFTLKD